jgi:hypothetical protein
VRVPAQRARRPDRPGEGRLARIDPVRHVHHNGVGAPLTDALDREVEASRAARPGAGRRFL